MGDNYEFALVMQIFGLH